MNQNKNTQNVGYEQVPRLDIRVLRDIGVLKEGERHVRPQSGFPNRKLIADLRDVEKAHLVFEGGAKPILVKLISRPAPMGGRRWFFLDEQNRRCEILYLSGSRLVSRKAAGLTYASKSDSVHDRWFARRDVIERKLKGDAKRGPARGQNRQKLLQELAQLDEVLEGVGGGLAGAALHSRQKSTARSTRSKQRLEDARAQIEGNQTVTPSDVLAKFGHLLRSWKPGKRASNASIKRGAKDDGRARRSELSLRVLQRLGYLVPGQLNGRQIGWPQTWLGKGCRLFVIFDLRKEGRFRAAIVLERGQDVTAQCFWIDQAQGDFGKPEFRFEDPLTGKQTGRLAVKRGAIRLVD